MYGFVYGLVYGLVYDFLVTILNTFVSFVSTEFFKPFCAWKTLYKSHFWLCLVIDRLNQQVFRHCYAFKRSYISAVTLIPYTSYIFCLNTLSHIQAIVSEVTYIQDNRVPFVKALKWRLSSECYIVICLSSSCSRAGL